MKPLYNIYLLFIRSGLKNDTSFSQVVSVEEQAALAALAEEHRTIPFVLPGFRNTPFYSAMLQKTKNMMLNYSQIDAFTRHTVSLLKENGVPCILLKGISLAACYPVPEYRKLGDLDLYINKPENLEKQKPSWRRMVIGRKKNSVTTISPIVIPFQKPAEASFWNFITG